MDKEQFIQTYLNNTGMEAMYGFVRTPTGFILTKRERVAVPCDCSESFCLGWKMIPKEDVGRVIPPRIFKPLPKIRKKVKWPKRRGSRL